jgi:hypothetical protein
VAYASLALLVIKPPNVGGKDDTARLLWNQKSRLCKSRVDKRCTVSTYKKIRNLISWFPIEPPSERDSIGSRFGTGAPVLTGKKTHPAPVAGPGRVPPRVAFRAQALWLADATACQGYDSINIADFLIGKPMVSIDSTMCSQNPRLRSGRAEP